MSARIRPPGALSAVLVSTLLAIPSARAQTCTVDNVYVAFNTYLGGARDDEVRDLQFLPNAKGAADLLLTGHTKSSTLPPGNSTALSTGDNNVFVSRLSPDGSEVRWTFLFGSDGDDSGARVAAGPSGDVYVAGRISKGTSTSITPAAYGFSVHLSSGGGTDAFVARLTAEGRPDWFLYLASAQEDEALGLALSNDAAYVVGKTRASFTDTFPKVPAQQGITRYGASGSDGNNTDAFIVKVPFATPSRPDWSRILATSPGANTRADDLAQAVLVQGNDVYFGGRLEGAPALATGENFPVDSHCVGVPMGVVMKLAADGKGKWMSCLGGREGGTEVQALLLPSGGDLLALGDTIAPDFLPPQAGINSGRDVFAHTLSSAGAPLKGLRVAAPGIQQARGRAALHPISGRVLLGGWTDAPLYEGMTLSGRNTGDLYNEFDGEGFVLSLAPDLKRPEWAAYVGGTDGKTQDGVAAVVVDDRGLVVLAGTSSATDLMRVRTGAELKAPSAQNGFVFGLMPDVTPPQSNPGRPLEVRLNERGHLEASWKELFTDAESGIASYAWSVFRANASTPEFTRSVAGDQAQADLSPSGRYTVEVRATNGAGCVTTVTSQPVGMETPAGTEPSVPGASQSPLGWTCGVTDPGALWLGGLGLVALLRRTPRR